MKKRLLAMLLAVVTTITSVPAPVYAAADDAVVDYVDEETGSEALEEVVLDDAEDVEVAEAPAEEAVVTEENNEAAAAADEVTANDDFAEETATEEAAAPTETDANEEAADAVVNKPDLTEEDTVNIANLLNNRGGTPAAPSLYGDQNYWFTEGEWDYQGGVWDDKVFIANINDKAAAANDKVWTVDPAVVPTYKFSVATGWNKDDKSKLSFKEITPGSVIDVDGLQVSANTTWLY
nr:hypothetical protein [Lachnospiraceae bacterium]